MKAVKKESKQSTKKRTRFQKYDWLGGQVMAHLFCVKCIVSSDTDDLLSELGKSGKSHCNTCNCTISLFVYCVSWLQTGEVEWFACRSISILSRPLLKGSSRGSVLSFAKSLLLLILNYWTTESWGIMVVFTCNQCGDSLKKNKVEPHLRQCRTRSLSCVDCLTDFE